MKREEAKKEALSILMDYVEGDFSPLISNMLEEVIEDWDDPFLLQMVCQESFE